MANKINILMKKYKDINIPVVIIVLVIQVCWKISQEYIPPSAQACATFLAIQYPMPTVAIPNIEINTKHWIILSMKLHFPIFVTPKTLDTYGYVIKGKT